MAQVIIAGGGIAGLATAYELHRQGVPFLLVEAGPRTGGVILSERLEGFTVDAGPDSLLTQKPDGIRLCEELGLGDRLVSTKLPRLAYVQRGGRLHPLPAASVLGIPTRFGPFVATRLFSWPGKLRMAAELFVPARKDDADESIGSFMRRRFGNEAVNYLAEPLLAGIHAGDVDRLSINALFPRFVAAERTSGSLLAAFRRQARATKGTPPSSEGAFKSLVGGLSDLTDALVRALPASSVRLNSAVCRIDSRASGTGDPADRPEYVVHVRGHEPLRSPALVLATPAYATSEIVSSFDPALAAACGEIAYASTGTVAMAFGRDAVRHPLNGSGFVVPRVENRSILAASWLSSKWPGRSPDDKVLMRAFVGGARDPDALDRSDEELIALALEALRPLLGISGEPLFTRVYRWKRANAQHEVGHLQRLASIEAAVGAHPGLFVTGSAFRGVGIPDCVADGRATARQVSAWLQAPVR